MNTFLGAVKREFRWILRLGLGVAAVFGHASDVVPIESEVLRPIQRVDAIRQELLSLDSKGLPRNLEHNEAECTDRVTQWFNWNNWNNWGNWGNFWNNWGNFWRNF